MKYKEMDWKAWLAVIIAIIIVSGIASGFMARAEEATPTDMEVVNDEGTYWLDEVEGEVILDDPAYFMETEEEPADKGADDTPAGETTTEGAATPSTDEPVTDPSDPPTDEGTDVPATDGPVTDPIETPDIPVEEPTETPTEQPTDTPEQPEEPEQPPVDLKTLFDVSIKVPSGWRNSYSATVRIRITPSSDQLWHKVRYRIGDEDWEPIKNSELVLYEGYYYTDIEVYYNAKMTVRLFGDEETYFDTNKEINIFDHYAPEVTAGFRDQVLHVEAVDDLAQVAGIQVNGLLFTTLVDGKLDVRMEEPLLSYKQLAIRAYDYAGNFSDPVTLDNPYYVEPTPEPTNTPKPTNKPTTQGSISGRINKEQTEREYGIPELKKGQELGPVVATLKEGKTMPPKHYTENSLLAAMETAGADDVPEDAERKGLGTPATRAGILEKLIATGFVIRKGDKRTKHLMPTPKGVALITILPEQLQSPLLTAEWEQRLKRIERGEESADAFLQDIRTMLTELKITVKPVKGAEMLFPSQKESIGACPHCGRPVTESDKGFFCTNHGCRFAIWKDNKFLTGQQIAVNRQLVQPLLKDKRVKLHNLHSKRTGKPYSATLVISCQDGGLPHFQFEFEGKHSGGDAHE